MDVLVIGGTGFMSGPVAAELATAGHAVTVFTRGERPLPEGMAAITGDRRDCDGFPRHFEGRPFDAVVDCICYLPGEAQSDLQAFAGRVGHFLMISTDFVYGARRALPMTEDTPAPGMNDYGRKKAAAEGVFLSAWRDEGFPATIFRPPHIMGAGGHLGSGSLQGRDPALLDRFEQRAPIVLLDGGSLLIQPVLHRDIGRAVAAALGRPETLGQAYNVAGPDVATTREYYDLIALTLGVEDPDYLSIPGADYIEAFPEKAPFATHRTYCLDKLARDTGYRPATTLRHAVFETVDWLQANEAARPYVETEQEVSIAALCRTYGEELGKVLGVSTS